MAGYPEQNGKFRLSATKYMKTKKKNIMFYKIQKLQTTEKYKLILEDDSCHGLI